MVVYRQIILDDLMYEATRVPVTGRTRDNIRVTVLTDRVFEDGLLYRCSSTLVTMCGHQDR